MNIQKRKIRNIEIVKYLLSGHVLFDTALHFEMSTNQVFLINKTLKLEAVKQVVKDGLSPETVARKMEVPLKFVEKALLEYNIGKLKLETKGEDK